MHGFDAPRTGCFTLARDSGETVTFTLSAPPAGTRSQILSLYPPPPDELERDLDLDAPPTLHQERTALLLLLVSLSPSGAVETWLPDLHKGNPTRAALHAAAVAFEAELHAANLSHGEVRALISEMVRLERAQAPLPASPSEG